MILASFLCEKEGDCIIYKLCPICGTKMGYADGDCVNGCKAKAKKERDKRYDQRVRYSKNKKYTEFYNSKEWQKIRRYILVKHNGLCLYSLLVDKKIVEADVVHHINPLRQSWGDRLTESNLIPLCHAVHNKLHEDYTDNKAKLLKKLLREWKNKF